MANESGPECVTSVNGISVDDAGRIDSIVSISDGENVYSRLTRIEDIAKNVSRDDVGEIYGGNFLLTAIVRTKDGTYFLSDAGGRVHTGAAEKWTSESVCEGRGLRCLWVSDDDDVYAAGTEGVVYRRAKDAWKPVSPPLGDWISAIGGSTHSNVVVVGDKGLAWRFDGATWKRIELGTKASLRGIVWTEPSFMISGAGGALFRGSGDRWDDVSPGGSDAFRMTSYAGDVWVACGKEGVGRLEDGKVTIVRSTFAAFQIEATSKYLVAAGNNIVARFDGKDWKGFGYQ